MKKIYVIAFVMIAAAIGLLISASEDMTTFTTFKEATASGKKVKINGELMKDKEMYYDEIKDPNYFTFYLKDTDGEQRKVVLYAAKPQDFERSEEIVVTGKMKGDEFVASGLLMKCPSKYKDEEVYIKSNKQT